MKRILTAIGIVLFFAMTAFAGFRGYQNTTDLGIFQTVKCSTGLSCTKVGDKLQVVSGSALATLVAATATTITASQCGSVFYNSGAVVINLPEASTVLGCKLTFVTLNASNFDVNPDNADQILVATNAAGDSIRNATLGNTITLQAVSASQWVVLGQTGTYLDNN